MLIQVACKRSVSTGVVLLHGIAEENGACFLVTDWAPFGPLDNYLVQHRYRDGNTNKVHLAPLVACGASLHPQASGPTLDSLRVRVQRKGWE
jgi:hypothetical protein